MNTVSRFTVSLIIAFTMAASGCGGGAGGGQTAGNGGIGGTGKIAGGTATVASGTITGFGSIFVNDIQYDIDAATCEVDDIDRTGDCQTHLRIGMVVTVKGSVNGSSGVATNVLFDSDVEGPVSGMIDEGSSKRFDVLGVPVVVDAAVTEFETGYRFSDIQDNDVVEISGFFDGNGVLNATYIERESALVLGTTSVELKGVVAATVPAAGAGSPGDSFIIDGVTLNIGAGTDLSDISSGLVTSGMSIEARGTLTTPTSIDATAVEQDGSPLGNNEDGVSIEGLVSNYIDNGDFLVAGQPVDASSAVLDPASLVLEDGLRVAVEGPVINGTLVAEEIEVKGGNIKVNATASARSVANSTVTLTLGSIPSDLTIAVDAKTKLRDATTTPPGPLTLAGIDPGDFLVIRAFSDGGGNFVAKSINRDSASDVILQGPMDVFDPVAGTITVLGVQFGTNGATEYDDFNDADFMDANAFDAAVSNGDFVKVKDTDPSDGLADEIDLEN
jgi:hypothetical protein